jgi:ABC-type bacteriocin/lantibiotic exporter with double-glycine peptidase domain
LAQGISLVYGMSGFGKKVILSLISSLICFVFFFSLFHILNYQFIFYNIAFCIFSIMNSILQLVDMQIQYTIRWQLENNSKKQSTNPETHIQKLISEKK